MIYGAKFSWNSNIPSYEDINCQISRIEYRDSSENYLAVVAKIRGKQRLRLECCSTLLGNEARFA